MILLSFFTGRKKQHIPCGWKNVSKINDEEATFTQEIHS